MYGGIETCVRKVLTLKSVQWAASSSVHCIYWGNAECMRCEMTKLCIEEELSNILYGFSLSSSTFSDWEISEWYAWGLVALICCQIRKLEKGNISWCQWFSIFKFEDVPRACWKPLSNDMQTMFGLKNPYKLLDTRNVWWKVFGNILVFAFKEDLHRNVLNIIYTLQRCMPFQVMVISWNVKGVLKRIWLIWFDQVLIPMIWNFPICNSCTCGRFQTQSIFAKISKLVKQVPLLKRHWSFIAWHNIISIG